MTLSTLRSVLLFTAVLLIACAINPTAIVAQPDRGAAAANPSELKQPEKNSPDIHYLEIVTPKVDETCNALEKTHGVRFGKPVPEFGNARMAGLKSGGRIGVRPPMRETEQPVVRPYLLVENIESAVEAAKAAGGEFAMLPTEIPGQGRFAIYFLGGIQYGLWQR